MGERQRFTREALYDLVWKEPPSRLARRFGLSDVGFAKTCRRLEVPLPARGYWRRRQVGQRVERPKLPPLRGGGSEWIEQVRAAAEAAERDGATATADPVEAIAVPAGLDGLSKPGARTHARLSRAKPDERGVVSARGKDVYAISVSPAQVDRATRIMDALVVACASRDMKVSLNPDAKRETALTRGWRTDRPLPGGAGAPP